MINRLRNSSILLPTVVLLAACSGESHKLDVPPTSEGISAPENLSWFSRVALDAYIRFSSWRGERSGYIVMFARDGMPIYSNAAGWKDIASDAPMTVDTHVRIASMTKPVTAVTAMSLVEEGSLGLDDRVSEYLPEFAQLRVALNHVPGPNGEYETRAATEPLRVRHLLMFSSGIGPGMEEGNALNEHWGAYGIYEQDSGDLRSRVASLAQLPLFEEPGTRWRYGYSADVLAAIIQVITGQGIEVAMRERVFDPLGMSNTRYEPLPAQRAEMATIYTQDSEGELVVVPDRNHTGWNPGGSGLVSTAGDYMRFALMLWNGGEYQGERILQRGTIEEMRRPHMAQGVLASSDIEGLGWGLGMAVVADEEATVMPDRAGDFWWSGSYGTTFVVSPATGLVGVIYTQNKLSGFSGQPYQVYAVQGIVYGGL
ncbi:MAG: serine hydrolase domain-containing protein [Halioglobus sp.]